MNKVYKHRPLAADEYLGRVDAEGRVYESRLGPDKLIGRVDIGSGKIYESRLGPDKYVGRVELDTGKVYLGKFGPDDYLGKVNDEGKLYQHKAMARDEYLGRVDDMTSLGHGGAAFLLLVVPAYDEQAQEAPAPDVDDPQLGAAPVDTG